MPLFFFKLWSEAMTIRVSGKHFQLGEALRSHVIAKITGIIEKLYGGLVNGSVVLDHEGSGYRTDCTLHLSSGITLHVEGYAQEAYASFDATAERLERR